MVAIYHGAQASRCWPPPEMVSGCQARHRQRNGRSACASAGSVGRLLSRSLLLCFVVWPSADSPSPLASRRSSRAFCARAVPTIMSLSGHSVVLAVGAQEPDRQSAARADLLPQIPGPTGRCSPWPIVFPATDLPWAYRRPTSPSAAPELGCAGRRRADTRAVGRCAPSDRRRRDWVYLFAYAPSALCPFVSVRSYPAARWSPPS